MDDINERPTEPMCEIFKDNTSVSSDQQIAVSVSDVYLGYNQSGNILRNVTMQVTSASIYGLLGPSGCGKTSLLKCLIGYFRPTRGSIVIHGYPQGHEKLGIPGPNIGYMPQECQLYNELTIAETLKYFARLFLMEPKNIDKSINHLITLLDLPSGSRRIGTLSGGQMRRVSFAAAIINKPKLVILDEPTAGVDPIVTEAIWQHLKYLSKEASVTVIVTTHYIEEARKADRVGLMRKGHILEEDSPEAIMKRYQASTLEDAFLYICNNKRNSLKNSLHLSAECSSLSLSLSPPSCASPTPSASSDLDIVKTGESETIYKPKAGMNPLNLSKAFTVNLSHWFTIVMIIFWKNSIRNMRNIPFMVCQFIVPIVPVVLLCLAIGLDPFDVRLAIVNDDYHGNYSQAFLKHIDSYHINAVPYDSLEEALSDIKKLQTWGVLHIKPNFSKSIPKRIEIMGNLNNETIESSTIKLYADLTDQLTVIHVRRSLDQTFHRFVQYILSKGNRQPTLAALPIRLEKPIFGESSLTRHDNFKRFSLPGAMAVVCFTFGYSITAIIITLERNDNMLDRHYVVGVSPLQFLTAHAFNRQISNIIQISAVLVICVYILQILDMPSITQLMTSFFLLFIISITAMSFGMVIAALVNRIEIICVISIAAMFALMIFSGVIWPVESMKPWLRSISSFSPVTQGAQGLRSIFLRGLGPWHPSVFPSFIICFGWSILFFFFGIRQFKFTT